MRALVTWGSSRGGTEGIGRMLGEALERHGFEVSAAPASRATSPEGFDAVIVGGALYSNRWSAVARRFVNRHVGALRKVPVWLFSSGPLSDAAEREAIPATAQVAVLAEGIGARGHVTFGCRLTADARGFPASAMAKEKAGDWRSPDRIRAWAAELATALANAVPGRFVDHPARSLARLLVHAVAGWALCAVTMLALLRAFSISVALALHAIAAPLVFTALAWRYFRARGAREALPTAVAWTAVVAVLDLVIVAGLAQRSFAMFQSVVGTWLPFALIFLATWATGEILSMMPGPARREADRRRDRP
jgi:menaquinone-dependent protoporphyrinogen oxidase